MLRSVALTVARLPDIPISHFLLLQRCSDHAFRAVERSVPPFVEATPIRGQVSLSAARNLLLSGAQAAGLIGRRTVIGFPDDDCWYPDGALEYIVRLFAHTPDLNLWFCKYSSSPSLTVDTTRPPVTPAVRDVVRYASSNTTFVRGSVLEQSPGFDETLGIGTANMGGEDTEFALRAYVFGG
ncbi:MAG TPA: hypothetical protein VFS68_05930, partial [Candidatus Udaeobacter sp.]|nr:hypothetical protein [Candidatus Udaeobacter sp.]